MTEETSPAVREDPRKENTVPKEKVLVMKVNVTTVTNITTEVGLNMIGGEALPDPVTLINEREVPPDPISKTKEGEVPQEDTLLTREVTENQNTQTK